jgi:hypothetical protein
VDLIDDLIAVQNQVETGTMFNVAALFEPVKKWRKEMR